METLNSLMVARMFNVIPRLDWLNNTTNPSRMIIAWGEKKEKTMARLDKSAWGVIQDSVTVGHEIAEARTR